MPPALFDPTRDELLPPDPEDLRGGETLEADPVKGTAAQPPLAAPAGSRGRRGLARDRRAARGRRERDRWLVRTHLVRR